jgi:DNA-directed RNA polymerase subunit F
MVYAFGLNLDTSNLQDVLRAKAHLEEAHSGWPQLKAFAQEVKKSVAVSGEMEFVDILTVVLELGERYAQWQGKDCTRVKEELMARPSHIEGRVLLADVAPSHALGRRSLLTENAGIMEKLGVLSDSSDAAAQQLIIANYVNSQSMCLSTASFYAACCINECEAFLAKLERAVAAPIVKAATLAPLVASLRGPPLSESFLQELHTIADKETGLVALHGRPFAGWMHRVFPLECPAPHNQKVTNPKTPDEWMGESGLQVADLEEMMDEIAQVLSRYTTMGGLNMSTVPAKKRHVTWVTGDGTAYDLEVLEGDDAIADSSGDIVRLAATISAPIVGQSRWRFGGMALRLMALASMSAVAIKFTKSSVLANLGSMEKKKGVFADTLAKELV